MEFRIRSFLRWQLQLMLTPLGLLLILSSSLPFINAAEPLSINTLIEQLEQQSGGRVSAIYPDSNGQFYRADVVKRDGRVYRLLLDAASGEVLAETVLITPAMTKSTPRATYLWPTDSNQ